MAKYIIDAHLPYYFALWSSEEYIHVFDIDEKWKDAEIWKYAKEKNLTIVTKDADFSNRVLLSQSPPRVIHVKFGNMKMKEFYQTINKVWEDVCKLSDEHRLIRLFKDRIECIS